MLKQRLRLALLRICGRVLRLTPQARTRTAEGPRSVLVIRPDHLGDVLLSRPAIDRLVQALPGARVVVAVGPWSRAALGTHSRFELLGCPFPGFSRAQGPPGHPYRLLLSFALLLRRQHAFDAALILRPDHWWGAWLAALAGIPVRLGYATPETSPFLTDCPRLRARTSCRPGSAGSGGRIARAAAAPRSTSLHRPYPRSHPPRPSPTTSTATLLLRETGARHAVLRRATPWIGGRGSRHGRPSGSPSWAVRCWAAGRWNDW